MSSAPVRLDDWATLRACGLTAVVDPMVFRAADMLFGGATGTDDLNARRWSAIDVNVNARGLRRLRRALRRVPLFDYFASFREYGR